MSFPVHEHWYVGTAVIEAIFSAAELSVCVVVVPVLISLVHISVLKDRTIVGCEDYESIRKSCVIQRLCTYAVR